MMALRAVARAAQQLSFPVPRTWGGRRRGAGRKPVERRPNVSHAARPAHDERHPVHVTLRATRSLPSLRSERAFVALRSALSRATSPTFRVVQFSVQTDHLHLIVEGASRERLIRGIQGLACRAARAVNRTWRRGGKVWGDRYHGRALSTPRQVRNGLVYVLLNFRKHLRAAPGVDPRSSGPWFDGWSRPPHATTVPRATSSPRTWLAAVGWRRAGGPIDPREAPA
jgi:putative transposase